MIDCVTGAHSGSVLKRAGVLGKILQVGTNCLRVSALNTTGATFTPTHYVETCEWCRLLNQYSLLAPCDDADTSGPYFANVGTWISSGHHVWKFGTKCYSVTASSPRVAFDAIPSGATIIGDPPTYDDCATPCPQGCAGIDIEMVGTPGATVPVGGGANMPAGHYRMTYLTGAYQISSPSPAEQWVVNYGRLAFGASYSIGWHITDSTGGDYFETPLRAVFSSIHPSQAEAEAAAAGAVQEFDWPGGSMQLAFVDPFSTPFQAGAPNPTWRLQCIPNPLP